MSQAAVDAVKQFSHPKVKGSARALLVRIAELIPEGQTMTAPIATDDFAIGYYDQAVRQARDVLAVEVKIVRIVGGGQGKKACYELLLLPGAAVADPVLPLRADLQPVTRPSSRPPPSTPSLFDTPTSPAADLRANNIGDFHRSWRSYFGDFHRSWTRLLSYFGDFHRSLVRFRADDIGDFHRSSLPLDVDDAGARDKKKPVRTHTHPAARDPDTASTGPPASETPLVPTVLHPWHAWCGAVCVPKQLHTALLGKGHRGDWLLAFYARTCALLTPAQIRQAVDEFKFWRAALTAELRAVAVTPAVEPPAEHHDDLWRLVDLWTDVLARLEATVPRHAFHTWLAKTILVAVKGEVFVVAADTDDIAAYIQKHHGVALAEAVHHVRPGARVEFETDAAMREKFG